MASTNHMDQIIETGARKTKATKRPRDTQSSASAKRASANVSLLPTAISTSNTVQRNPVDASSSWREELGDISLSGISDLARSPNYSEMMKFVQRQDSDATTANAGSSTEHFQMILMAPTSAAVPISQESLTYINQGQAYEVLCKKLGPDNQPLSNGKYRTKISLSFHERRHKFEEKRLFEEWRKCHHEDLPLVADTPVSTNVSKVHSGGTHVEFVWDTSHRTSMYIKVNTISTEFAARKHGGEKGVPFRLTISTYRYDVDKPSSDGTQLVHSCYAQIRVFRLKGADRRNRLDRERAEKRLDSERFQPAYDYTIMTETFPNDMSSCELESNLKLSTNSSDPSAVDSNNEKLNSTLKTVSPTNEESSDFTESPQNKSESKEESFKQLSPTANVSETTVWLKSNRFERHIEALSDYNAADLLRLNVDSLIRIISDVGNAYRLYNTLRAKCIEPKTKIYVRQPGETVFAPVFLHALTKNELTARILCALTDSDTTGRPSMTDVVWRNTEHGILVKVTDELVASWSDDVAFTVELLSTSSCTTTTPSPIQSKNDSNGSGPTFDVGGATQKRMVLTTTKEISS